jgi:hypothetical protein
MRQQHVLAEVHYVDPDRGFSFAHTPDNEVIYVHADRYRTPRLGIIASGDDIAPLKFELSFVPVDGEIKPPSLRKRIRLIPRPTGRTTACQSWMGIGAWNKSDVYNLTVSVFVVESREGVETSVECVFWGKLGDLQKQFPLGADNDPLQPASYGNGKTDVEFRCWHTPEGRRDPEMMLCEDPRFLML